MEASLAHFFWKFSSPHRIIVLSMLHVAIALTDAARVTCREHPNRAVRDASTAVYKKWKQLSKGPGVA